MVLFKKRKKISKFPEGIPEAPEFLEIPGQEYETEEEIPLFPPKEPLFEELRAGMRRQKGQSKNYLQN